MSSLRQRLFKRRKNDDKSKLLTSGEEGENWEEVSVDSADLSEDEQGDNTEKGSAEVDSENLDGECSSPSHTDPQAEEKAVYELQLTQLQEQLVSAMIDNETLKSELMLCEDRGKLDQLVHSLESEREKVRLLEQQVINLRAATRDNRTPDPVDASEDFDMVDEAREATEDALSQASSSAGSQTSLYSRASSKFAECFFMLLEDFTGDPDPEPKAHADESLAVKRLKENIKRFRSGSEPGWRMTKVVSTVLSWRSPIITAVCFIIYMCAVWQDWLAPLVFGLCIMQLFVNFLQHKGWNINLNLLGGIITEEKDGETFSDLGVSEKFELVLHVATKVQNTLGLLADNLEKLKNLLTWKQPDATGYILRMLLLAFCFSCFVSGATLLKTIALYAGVKFFLINYLYTRFPRFQQRHDTLRKIWRELPTDAQYEVSKRKAVLNQYIEEPKALKVTKKEGGTVSVQAVSEDSQKFCDTFDLPYTEKPLSGWEGGRRATYILKDKSLTSAFTHGKLYLTTSFLCFEASKKNTSKNIIIPLVEIKHINKAKPYSWMPGSGMAVEIAVMQQEKPYLFGGMLNRDECYQAIRAQRMQRKISQCQPTVTVSSSDM